MLGGIIGATVGQQAVEAVWQNASSALKGLTSGWLSSGDTSDKPTDETVSAAGAVNYTASDGGTTIVLNYNGTTLASVDQDNSNGSSQITTYQPASSVSAVTMDYTGPDGTGTNTQNMVTYTNDTSALVTFNPASGNSATIQAYTGPNDSGALTAETVDYTNDTSALADLQSGQRTVGDHPEVHRPQ